MPLLAHRRLHGLLQLAHGEQRTHRGIGLTLLRHLFWRTLHGLRWHRVSPDVPRCQCAQFLAACGVCVAQLGVGCGLFRA